MEVYDAQSHQPLLSHRPLIAHILPNARIVGWASDGNVLILEVFIQGPITEEHPQGRVHTVLYDVDHDIARIVFDDAVVGWQNGQAIVREQEKFSKRSLPSLPLLPAKAQSPASCPNTAKMVTSWWRYDHVVKADVCRFGRAIRTNGVARCNSCTNHWP